MGRHLISGRRPRYSRRRAFDKISALAVIVGTVLFAAACSSEGLDSAGPDRSATAARRGGHSLSWQRCDFGTGIECTTVAVPLDWSAPSGDEIELAVGRRRATGTRLGSLYMNPGGPGSSGMDLLSIDLGPIAEHYDLVSWDPRGVGGSHGLECGTSARTMLSLDPDPDTGAERSALENAASSVASSCGSEGGDLLSHMTTEDSAKDLDAIRRALGDDRISYLGYSYGTHIGQLYASLFPDTVDKMVLDGVVDPQQSFVEFLLGQTAAFDRALGEQSRKCSSAGEGTCGVKDLLGTYDKVRAKVELQPLSTRRGPVGPAELATAALAVVYQPDGWLSLGPALRDALGGNGSALRSAADRYYNMGNYGAYASVVCTDGPTPRGFEEYRDFEAEAIEVSSRFGATVANELLPCAVWPAESQDRPEARVAELDPIIIIGNTGDAATPYENAERVHSRIPDSVLVTVRSDGHTAFGSNVCVNRIVTDYLVDSKLPSKRSVTCS